MKRHRSGEATFRRSKAAGMLAIALATLFANAVSAAARPWIMEPATSQLTFTPRLAGGDFQGRFERFSATVRFDPADLPHSSLLVVVDLLSARTGDSDRDTALQGTDFFATSRWPQARFASTAIRSLGGNRYEARGKLTLRDTTRDVAVPFRFDLAAPSRSTARLTGATTVQRLPFGVGQGEWRSIEWLADDVRIAFELALHAAP